MKKMAYMFAGQNSERLGMLGDLYRESRVVRDTFAEASEVLRYDVAQVCFGEDSDFLHQAAVSAPIIVMAHVATYRHITDQYKFKPSLMAGHSLGEYGALTCAGVLPFSDVLTLVTHRAKLADRIAAEKAGVMTVVYQFPISESEKICQALRAEGRSVWIGCYNSHEQATISGKAADITELEWYVANKGGAYKRLMGKSSFHCPLLQDITDEFAEVIQGVEICSPSIPVISNYTVMPHTIDNIYDNLIQHLVAPVRWQETISYIKRQHVELLIELGSGMILTNLINQGDEELQALSYEIDKAQINEMDLRQVVGQ
ncbi:ACP S-malonyltransferase [Bacillus sp. SD088]|nr:ACP S-malonyltransferase [Bacillus sp. SD088]